MAYVQIRTIRYNPMTNSQYADYLIDELLKGFEQVGIEAFGKKFGKAVNLANDGVLLEHNMPNWIKDMANTSLNWVMKYTQSGSNRNAGTNCWGCIYWEKDNIKYTYFLGGATNSDINYDYNGLSDTLVQNLYVDGCTDSKANLIIGQTHDNFSPTYRFLGELNVPDYFTIALTNNALHFYIRGKNTDSYNMYAGHNKTSYIDSLVNTKYAWATKVPVHNNMVKTLACRSFGCACYDLINPADGDIPTGKYYSFDVFYGIRQGTIMGLALETKCIPYLPCNLGNVASVGGEIFLRIGNVTDSQNQQGMPLMVKVS